MYEQNKKIVTESETMNDTMNFKFLPNTGCKFVLNIYDARGTHSLVNARA